MLQGICRSPEAMGIYYKDTAAAAWRLMSLFLPLGVGITFGSVASLHLLHYLFHLTSTGWFSFFFLFKFQRNISLTLPPPELRSSFSSQSPWLGGSNLFEVGKSLWAGQFPLEGDVGSAIMRSAETMHKTTPWATTFMVCCWLRVKNRR